MSVPWKEGHSAGVHCFVGSTLINLYHKSNAKHGITNYFYAIYLFEIVFASLFVSFCYGDL